VNHTDREQLPSRQLGVPQGGGQFNFCGRGGGAFVLVCHGEIPLRDSRPGILPEQGGVMAGPCEARCRGNAVPPPKATAPWGAPCRARTAVGSNGRAYGYVDEERGISATAEAWRPNRASTRQPWQGGTSLLLA
jgi:hypothetical protein